MFVVPLHYVTGMELVTGPGGSHRAAVDFDADVGEFSDAELVEELGRVGVLRAQAEARLADIAAEVARRDGGRAASEAMRYKLHVSARQANAEVALAESLREHPVTAAEWRAGRITAGHARVIARVASDPEHCDEAALLAMACDHPVDVFSRMTRRWMKPERSADERRRQRQARWASLVQDPDGSWRLSACFDADAGKSVSVAFNAMLRRFRNDPPPPATIYDGERSGAHLRADALASLITGQAPCERPDTMLLVIADYDICSQQLRGLRYDDAQPVAPDHIARLCAQAQILPAIFSADGDPLWLGRAARRASLGQRIVLAARDGGCVNCAAPADAAAPHHIRWHSRGGPTDIDNLALLCDRCHHLIHDDDWHLRPNNHNHQHLQPPDTPPPANQTAVIHPGFCAGCLLWISVFVWWVLAAA